MVTFTDQMQRRVSLPNWPSRRIISLVPSQTELLAALGLEKEVVGLTKFCVHPLEWFQEKKRIGGTKTLNFEKIAALNPDLILGNKEENQQDQIEWLSQRFPVWMSDILSFEDALAMIREVGKLTDTAEPAHTLAASIESKFQLLDSLAASSTFTAAYLIWRKPFMAAGADTFVHEMLGYAGFQNVFGHKSRYPETSLIELTETQAQVILLSSEPFPFSEKHIVELQAACPKTKILLVDGEMFSWYGSRLQMAPDYFLQLRQKLKTIK